MHLLYYTHSLLQLHAFSTLFSALILIGSGYGLLSLIHDATVAWRRNSGK